ncbi:MbtH family protein [Streptomyces bikiniensis]|uniref:MbtH family protein n=1 Tax=Streptomyces bikiniensis TaxID=1896 RepID=A0ABW8D538_STRBI
MSDQGKAERTHLVVRNDDGQYSVWLKDRRLPDGWTSEGTQGTREECLAHVAEIWQDMRPLSLRSRIDRYKAGSNELGAVPVTPALTDS